MQKKTKSSQQIRSTANSYRMFLGRTILKLLLLTPPLLGHHALGAPERGLPQSTVKKREGSENNSVMRSRTARKSGEIKSLLDQKILSTFPSATQPWEDKLPEGVTSALSLRDPTAFSHIVYFTQDPFLGDNLIRYGKLPFLHEAFPRASIHLLDPACGILLEKRDFIECRALRGLTKGSLKNNAEILLHALAPYFQKDTLFIFEKNSFDSFNFALKDFVLWEDDWIDSFHRKIKDSSASVLEYEAPLIDHPTVKLIEGSRIRTKTLYLDKAKVNVEQLLLRPDDSGDRPVRSVYLNELLNLKLLFGKHAYLSWTGSDYLPIETTEEDFLSYVHQELEKKGIGSKDPRHTFVTINLNTAGDWKVDRIRPHYLELMTSLLDFVQEQDPSVDILLFPIEPGWGEKAREGVHHLVDERNKVAIKNHLIRRILILDEKVKGYSKYAMSLSHWFLTMDSFPGHAGAMFNDNVHILYTDKGLGAPPTDSSWKPFLDAPECPL